MPSMRRFVLAKISEMATIMEKLELLKELRKLKFLAKEGTSDE
jgi:hypothetical protein